jgi:ribosomal protein S18 acetylase RimI-like enzyme
MYTLRPATIADAAFLYQLHVAAMRDVVAATWGWDETWQRQHFAARFAPETIKIIQVTGEPAGMLELERRETEFFVGNLKLLPGVQGRGLGTAVLGDILAIAARENLPVRLQVLAANLRARRFYERLGFGVTGEVSPHIQMTRAASVRSRANER